MYRGFVKFWRSSVDNDLYFKEPFTKWQAWQDLILLANWEPTIYEKRGIEMNIDRGQLAWSEKGLAGRWKWSRQKVRGLLASLKLKGQIEHQNNNVTTLITIVNYDLYQEKDTKKDTRKTPERHQKNTSKEVKEVKEEPIVQKTSAIESKFNIFWDAFNYKDGRKQALATFKKINPSEQVFDLIIAGAKSTAAARPALQAKGLTPKMGQGWLNDARWEDEPSESKPANSASDINKEQAEQNRQQQEEMDNIKKQFNLGTET